MMNLIRSACYRLTGLINSNQLSKNIFASRNYSSLLCCRPIAKGLYLNQLDNKPSLKTNLNLLPSSVLVTKVCGLRVKGRLRLRCSYCYYACIDGIMHVLCERYPRHKQRAMHKRLKYTWILTHATQSKYRPY